MWEEHLSALSPRKDYGKRFFNGLQGNRLRGGKKKPNAPGRELFGCTVQTPVSHTCGVDPAHLMTAEHDPRCKRDIDEILSELRDLVVRPIDADEREAMAQADDQC